MTRGSGAILGFALLLAGAVLSVIDVLTAERSTIVVYATPALRDLLEKDVVPRFRRETGQEVALVYVPAGQQFNRLRMSGERPEADLFLHASPLYLEKGFASRYIDPVGLREDESIPDAFKSRSVVGGRVWYAFAWSPLVEVYGREVAQAPDLLTAETPFGFPHPMLSNNGIYAVLFFEEAAPAAGRNVLRHTRVQPVNARANIGGVADGSFALTLGYEAVVRFYQEQGAQVRYELPLAEGERITTPVVFSAALIHGRRHRGAEGLLRFLFTEKTQRGLGRFFLRRVARDEAPGLLDLEKSPHRMIDYDWSRWECLEEALSEYEVKS